MSTDRLVYTVPEVLAECGISRAFFYKQIREGKGPRLVKMGRRTLIRGEALKNWLTELEGKCELNREN